MNLECLVNEIIANNDVVVVEKPEKSSKKKSAKAFTDNETRLLISSGLSIRSFITNKQAATMTEIKDSLVANIWLWQ